MQELAKCEAAAKDVSRMTDQCPPEGVHAARIAKKIDLEVAICFRA